jgi:aromatic-L-amino-acid/L-tryptophan decarboxylase
MRTYGLSGMQQHIRNSISLGTLFANLIRSRSDLFEIFVEPAFALTVFTVKEDPSSDIATVSGGYPADGEITDKEIKGDLTRRVFQKIEREGKMFPSSAVVGGTFVIRVVSGLPALKESDIREAFEIVVKAVEDVKNGKE